MIDYETCPKCSKPGLSYLGTGQSGNPYYGCKFCDTIFNEGQLLLVKASKKVPKKARRRIRVGRKAPKGI